MEVHAPKMNERAVKIPLAKSQPVPHDTKTRMMTENTRMNHAQILKGSNSVRWHNNKISTYMVKQNILA